MGADGAEPSPLLEHGLQDAAGSAYANLGTLAVEERRHELAAKVLDDGIAYASERDLRTRILCIVLLAGASQDRDGPLGGGRRRTPRTSSIIRAPRRCSASRH